MSFQAGIKYAVYNLRTSFAWEPRDLRYCPTCASLLLLFSIPPSKAVVSDLSHHSGIHFGFSHLYECSVCNWWAIQENWLDLGGADSGYGFLIVGEKTSQNDSAWRQLLKNTDIYFEATTLPDTIRQLFTQKDISDYYVPGDRVRLRTNVVVRQPLGISPPLCVRGSEGIIVRESEYFAQYAQQLKDWYVSENILLQDVVKRAMLREAQAVVESGFCCAVRLQNLAPMSIERSERLGVCRTGEIYLVETSELERL